MDGSSRVSGRTLIGRVPMRDHLVALAADGLTKIRGRGVPVVTPFALTPRADGFLGFLEARLEEPEWFTLREGSSTLAEARVVLRGGP